MHRAFPHKKFTIRLPTDLAELVERIARQNGRAPAQEIVQRLEWAYEQMGRKALNKRYDKCRTT